jgi:hypothetical protein
MKRKYYITKRNSNRKWRSQGEKRSGRLEKRKTDEKGENHMATFK